MADDIKSADVSEEMAAKMVVDRVTDRRWRLYTARSLLLAIEAELEAAPDDKDIIRDRDAQLAFVEALRKEVRS